jgi:hypothetical protein
VANHPAHHHPIGLSALSPAASRCLTPFPQPPVVVYLKAKFVLINSRSFDDSEGKFYDAIKNEFFNFKRIFLFAFIG